MVLTNKKYIEPSKVLKALVDDFGNPIEFGEQKDVAEFNLNLLQRIQEGLGERPKKKENLNEEEKNELKSGRLERSSSILGDDIEAPNKEIEQSLTVS
jgi:ubiquitin carboxyl-terminal hydrolase 25/28